MDIRDVAGALAAHAEAVCRHYLPNGRRSGRYWTVGDLAGSPGRSLFVNLSTGRWTDAATGQHGDLLDVIHARAACADLAAAMREAKVFLALPETKRATQPLHARTESDRTAAARKLWDLCGPLAGTLAEAYLVRRGLVGARAHTDLRFHPRCRYRDDDGTRREAPAMVAAVRDHARNIIAVHRTFLSADPVGKADMAEPRRALGPVLGYGVRLGATPRCRVLATGEGIETMLSVRAALPGLPCLAALSAGHLGGLRLWPELERLYIAADRNNAGQQAARRLAASARRQGIDAIILRSRGGDFNDDLRQDGADVLEAHLRAQLASQDDASAGAVSGAGVDAAAPCAGQHGDPTRS